MSSEQKESATVPDRVISGFGQVTRADGTKEAPFPIEFEEAE